MNTSQTIGNLAKALSEAQVEMKAAKIDSENPFLKSKYASLASVIEAIKPISERGLALIQTVSIVRDWLEVKPAQQNTTGERSREGKSRDRDAEPNTRVIVNVTTTLVHTSGEFVADTLSLVPNADTPQAIGSVITYGRRYLAAAICGIASEDDDDGEAGSRGKEQSRGRPTDSKAQQAKGQNQTPEQIQKDKDLKVIGDLAKVIGFKNSEETMEAISGIIGRALKNKNELTTEDRAKVIENFRMQADETKGNKSNGTKTT
jgi:hypothetical protein